MDKFQSAIEMLKSMRENYAEDAKSARGKGSKRTLLKVVGNLDIALGALYAAQGHEPGTQEWVVPKENR